MEQLIDKSKELSASICLVNDKLNFLGIVENNKPISIDYIPPYGDNLGYTSLELLLFSLSSCIGSAVLLFLRKMKKSITGLEIYANGIRREEHPTGFRIIIIEIKLQSPDITGDDLSKVLTMSEEKYCPVWSMLKGNVTININYKINNNATENWNNKL
jgi:putative redox protein